MKSFNDFLKKQLENPAVEKEYKRIDPQFQVAKEIIKLRIKRGVTQKELALRIGSTQAVISRIESGSTNCSINTIQRIAEALQSKLMIQIEPDEYVPLLEEFVIEPIKKVKNESIASQKGNGNLHPNSSITITSSDWEISENDLGVKNHQVPCLS